MLLCRGLYAIWFGFAICAKTSIYRNQFFLSWHHGLLTCLSPFFTNVVTVSSYRVCFSMFFRVRTENLGRIIEAGTKQQRVVILNKAKPKTIYLVGTVHVSVFVMFIHQSSLKGTFHYSWYLSLAECVGSISRQWNFQVLHPLEKVHAPQHNDMVLHFIDK